MSGIGRNRLIGYSVVGLAVLNIALLTFIWFNSGSQRRSSPRKQGMIFLEQQLNLSPEQQTKLEQLRQSHFKEMTRLRQSSIEAREALHELWSKEVAEAEIKSLTKKIGDNESQIEWATFNHFAEMRKLFNEDQAEKFDLLIKDVLRQGERRGPEPGGTPPKNGRPGGVRPQNPGR